jgi:hypothetical protein
VPEQSHDLDVKFHEAGWDSFCAGYCFIRMAHLFAHVTVGGCVLSNVFVYISFLFGAVSSRQERPIIVLKFPACKLPFSCDFYEHFLLHCCSKWITALCPLCAYAVWYLMTGVTSPRSGQIF